MASRCSSSSTALIPVAPPRRRRWPTAEIVAVDFSPRSIAVARKLQRTVVTGKPITFRVADLTDENLVRSDVRNAPKFKDLTKFLREKIERRKAAQSRPD